VMVMLLPRQNHAKSIFVALEHHDFLRWSRACTALARLWARRPGASGDSRAGFAASERGLVFNLGFADSKEFE